MLFFVPKINFSDVLRIFSELGYKFIILFLILKSFSIILMSYRLKYILGIQKFNYNLRQLIKLYFLGIFYNNFLPTQYGGDIFKAYILSYEQKDKFPIYYSILADRIIGFSSIIFIGFIAAIISFESLEFLGNAKYIYLVFPILFFLLLYFLSSSWSKKTINFYLTTFGLKNLQDKINLANDSITPIKNNKMELFIVIFISFLVQTNIYLAFYAISLALHMDVILFYFFLFFPAIAMISAIPISINGIGVRESGIVFFFINAGVTANMALSLSLLILFFLVIDALIGGIINIKGDYKFQEK
ncbi:MAG: hypothetical protein SCARUB_00295 [Candidatus Scalindua rubra]|uniref:Flippase-like domain-containing protein n=1 Tax=Candidatus Scalindua rubra TaxID=1872076 RepID=A0A1E3XG16_9BACT|nr:MAG: hypothetical protein SCARUB_00295 [Candidatus Scalindua rubra]